MPDVPKVERAFDYLLPDEWRDRVTVGTIVRVDLHGRRVDGWVLEIGVEPESDVELKRVAQVAGQGPDEAMIDLCRWAAHRWAGWWVTFLRAASPERRVSRRLPPPGPTAAPPESVRRLTRGRFEAPVEVLRLPPAEDPSPWLWAAASMGQALIICGSAAAAHRWGRVLRERGVPITVAPDGWAEAAAGHSVIGARAAAFAPAPSLAVVVVLDEHDEALGEEGSPTWHAREVALERARRAGVPALLISPVPSLEALAAGPLVTVDRRIEREGWAVLEVVDLRGADPRAGLWTPAFVRRAREVRSGNGRVVVVLNRTGRAAQVACSGCGALADCEHCGASVRQPDASHLHCDRCGSDRPVVCRACGGTRLKLLRIGVDRAAEELTALLGAGVHVVTGASGSDPAMRTAPVVVGTEAVLHRCGGGVGLVAFPEFDREALATRYRAGEEALALLARASRVVGGRSGRVLVQTRLPDHEVVDAALHADPGRLVPGEGRRRELVGMPPACTVAVLGGEAAPVFMERFGVPDGVEVVGPNDGRWLLRSEDRARLLDSLAAVRRPPGRLRLQVDPLRLR